MTQENVPISNAQTDRISRLIGQLKSPSKNKRYDACEDLRVTDYLPEKALKALEETTHDSDRDVAEAARDAFTFHTQLNINNEQTKQENNPTIMNFFEVLGIAAIVLIATILCLFVLLVFQCSVYGCW